MILHNFSDKELYKACQEAGKKSRQWMREFAYYLPEVRRRRLHRRRGFVGIKEFAARLCSMNHDVCDRVLKLSDKFEGMPEMWELIKVYGWSKLRVIAGVVNSENQEIWMENLERCVKKDLEELVKVYRLEKLGESGDAGDSVPCEEGKTGAQPLFKPYSRIKVFKGDKDPSHYLAKECEIIDIEKKETTKLLKFKVDSETEFLFRKLKQKLEKERKEAVTMGEVLKVLLREQDRSVKRGEVFKVLLKKGDNLEKERKDTTTMSESLKVLLKQEEDLMTKVEILKVLPKDKSVTDGQVLDSLANAKLKKQKISESDQKIPRPKARKAFQKQTPEWKKQEVRAKQNDRCVIPSCNNPIDEFHHPSRLSLQKTHDNLVGVCRSHHRLAHSGYLDNETGEMHWKKLEREADVEFVDARMLGYLHPKTIG